MTLHCASRLGVVSWIYEQRHAIAFELGLSDERPIAECGLAFFDNGLVVVETEHDSTIFQASSIDLFFVFDQVDVNVEFSFIYKHYPFLIQKFPPAPDIGIFHPPSIA